MPYKRLSFTALFGLATALQAQTATLEPVVVTAAYKTEQKLSDLTASVSVITAEEIEALHPGSVAELLERLPGLTLTSNGGPGTTQNLLMRGMGTERILVLIDGVRFQDPSNTAGALLTHLMVADIERIEVIRGAQSGIWGADAAAGVVNIVTKKAKAGAHAALETEAGSYQTRKASAMVSYNEAGNRLKLAASRMLSNGFSAQAPYGEDPDDYEDDPYRNTTVTLAAGHDFTGTTSLDVTYHDINAFNNFDSYGDPDAIRRGDYRSKLVSTLLKQRLGDHDLQLQYDHTTFVRDDLDTTFGVKRFEGRNRNVELRDRIDYAAGSFANVGLQREYFDADYTTVSLSAGSMKSDTTALYAVNSNRFGDWSVTEALRYDDYSNFDAKTTGKIGVIYRFGGETALSANYGTAYNAPSIIKILNPWGASNPDLEPETTRSFDVGVSWRDAAVTLFYNKVDNLISWEGSGYVNGDGESRFRGVEASYDLMATDALLIHANYTYTQAKNGLGQILKQRPRHQALLSLDCYATEALHIGTSAEYVGTRYNSDDKQGRQTGRYTLWNLVVNYDISDAVSAYAKVDNLTDKRYQTIDGYATAERSGYVGLRAEF